MTISLNSILTEESQNDAKDDIKDDYKEFKKTERKGRPKSVTKTKPTKRVTVQDPESKPNDAQTSAWDAPLQFEDNSKRATQEKAKKSKSTTRIGNAKIEAPNPTVEQIEALKTMSLEEKYRELKKKRKIKNIGTHLISLTGNIELQDDIDVKFKELPKRLRTRITQKQMRYIMNNTTMSDIIGHLISQNKTGIKVLPPQRKFKYTKVINEGVSRKAKVRRGMRDAVS